MDNLEQRLNSILSDPESLSTLSQLAESFLAGGDENQDKADEHKDDSNSGSEIDIAAFARLSGILGNLSDDNEESRLLLALKPYLKDKRKEKVDETVKLMKLIKLAPLLKEIKL